MGARPGPATSAAGDDARSMDFDVTGTLELIRRDPRVHLLEVFATSVLSLPDAREA